MDTEYFTNYEDLEVHRLMIEDSSRTFAYKNAILSNKAYFKGKTVMDVGCGTGILSLFCAQAGAKKVYAIEASNLAELAKEIVKDNKFENVIEVINSKVEDVVLPPDVKVDAIVSEWMGFHLLHEGMLDSVLTARDKFLKENGEMFPESAAIYVAPCSLPTLYDSWEDVYGIKLSTFAKHLRYSMSKKPQILTVQSEDLLGNESALCWIDLKDDKHSVLDLFTMKHVLGASRCGPYQGICVWFECLFPDLDRQEPQVILSTSPYKNGTHWKQTVIVLPEQQNVEEGEPIAFELIMKRDAANSRRYTFELELLDPAAVEHPTPCSCHMTKCIIVNTFLKQSTELEPREEVNNILEKSDLTDYD